MILITGATGHIGTAVIQQLLTKIDANQVAGLVRDAAKATHLQELGIDIRLGDYDNPAALERAMQGIDKVLLVSGGGDDHGLQQHYNVVDAAKKAGVSCIAYTGRALQDRDTLANDLMVRHFQTEDYIKASGLHYVLFRNILYMDTLPQFVGPAVFASGIHLPAGEGRVSFALRSDMGEAIANVLAEGDCENRTYTFTNTETYSFADVAAALSELSGKEVRYTALDDETFAAQMKARNVPETVTRFVLGFMTDIKHGQESAVSNELQQVLGRKPTALKEGLKTLFSL
ncbi:SDR family oxidoreductase [Hymenobacter sp. NBH84]|uniref:SDR family oxidoreductase n=1 Tax=Hymenobacter sp. NBH84 TaxID=2596915 RepID=UPI00162418B7|nr:SDR family oxidoreductase [Hymenobacter sp. NBH84]QNE39453.1 SDR family oxidoreductase [Hymenobacter sp. NBH84]